VVFRLDHGGEVDADGNCLFTAARTAAAAKADARELRHRAVRWFAEVYIAAGEDDKAAVNAAVRHCNTPVLYQHLGTANHACYASSSILIIHA